MQQTAILLAALAVASCRPTDGCTPAESRCTGQTAEVCDSNGRWQTLADCDRVSEQSGAAFVCGATSLPEGGAPGYTCLPDSGIGGGPQ
jgi:hypothetical protein